MSAVVIDGKKLSKNLLLGIKEEVQKLPIKPLLTVIRVEGDGASEIYVRKKKEACELTGIRFNDVVLSKDASEIEMLEAIEKFNEDSNTTGLIVQLPLPSHINPRNISNLINPAKDVDGLNPLSTFVPATAKGVMKILKSIGFHFEGANAVVVGRSALVGTSIYKELLKRNCTVTVCHSKTKELVIHTKMADLLVVAVGHANLIISNMVKAGAVVVDVGITRVNNKLVGDVDFENVKEIAGYITPVIGGAGPMTVASLLSNVLEATKH